MMTEQGDDDADSRIMVTWQRDDDSKGVAVVTELGRGGGE